LTLFVQAAHAGAIYRPGQQQRTVSASTFQVSIQKNGRADIFLLNGERAFVNAFPAVLFEGDDEWTELDISSRYTFRERVNDPLGQGQSIIMAKGNCEWAIRTYSTQPFFTVQAVFINTGRKPVRVRAMSPWRTADTRKPGGLWLGKNSDAIRTLVLREAPPEFVSTQLASEWPVESDWHVGVYNPESKRTLIAGVLGLTAERATFSVAEHTDDDAGEDLLLFDHAVTLEEPVEVKPNERLAMPMAYFAVSETDPLLGLQRYGQALARFNDIDTADTQVPSANARDAAQFFRGNRSDLARLQPSAAGSWDDAVDALTNAARLAHFTPYFWRPDTAQGRLSLPGANESQQSAWLTGLAFSGSALQAAGAEPSGAVARLLPPPARAAHPVDLFRNERPQIWALPMDTEGGHAVVALFNWDTDAPQTIELAFAELGLARNAYYTVYDSWPRQYMGTAADSLRVAILPGSVRVLSLRRHWDDPVVLSVGDHITTVSNPEDGSDWDAAARTLSGDVHMNRSESVRIDVLVPERFSRIESTSDNVKTEWPPDSRVVTLTISKTAASIAEWEAKFE
jgi:hypothetical protein